MTLDQTTTVDESQTTGTTGGGQTTVETTGTTVDNGDMSANYTHIKTELEQVGTGSNENLEIEQASLNGAFADYLINTPQGGTNALSVLRDRVRVVKESRNLRSRAGKDAVDSLATFLDDIGDSERMEKDYEEFMKKMENPKKLNTMHTWEIRRLNLYLGMHEDKALSAYKLMKSTVGHFEEKGMKSQDQEFFNTIRESLKSNYSKNDKFVNEDYPAVGTLLPTVESLKTLAGGNWDGTSESINVPAVENSIVDINSVKEKVKEVNQRRIEANETKVKSIVVDFTSEKSNFKKENGVLKYNDVEFTADSMMNTPVFRQQIDSKADDNTQFVGDEKNNMVLQFKQDIYNNSVAALSDIEDTTTQQNENPANPENPSEGLADFEVDSKSVVKIKDQKLKDAITSDPKFCESLDGEKVKFNMTEVKNYLESIKDTSWKDLKKLPQLDKEKWVISVQIALKYLNDKDGGDYKGTCDVQWIDGNRESRTRGGVKGFQDKYTAKYPDDKLNSDGAPGPLTIKAILKELGGVSGSTETTGSAETQSLSDFTLSKDKVKDDSNLRDNIKNRKFCENFDGEDVKFKMEEIKNHLSTLNAKVWKDFKDLSADDQQKWIVAVQVALSFLNSDGDYKDKFDVGIINGEGALTKMDYVEKFQNEWNTKHSTEKQLAKDGFPGKETITAILGELNARAISTTSTTPGEDAESNNPTSEETQITSAIDSMGSSTVLNLSSMTSLTDAGATKIADGLNGKSGMTVDLSGLTSLDGSVAQKLSVIDGKIKIDGILNADLETKLDNSDFVSMLQVLTDKLTIQSPNQDICDKVKAKSSSIKIEVVATS